MNLPNQLQKKQFMRLSKLNGSQRLVNLSTMKLLSHLSLNGIGLKRKQWNLMKNGLRKPRWSQPGSTCGKTYGSLQRVKESNMNGSMNLRNQNLKMMSFPLHLNLSLPRMFKDQALKNLLPLSITQSRELKSQTALILFQPMRKWR